MKRGKFITFEGLDAAGKSTQITLLQNYLRQRGIDVLQTREPGGTDTGEALRQMVLYDKNLDGLSETLLMFAARREHIVHKIAPALAAGRWVLCDRFTDSTAAYQGGGRDVPLAFIDKLAAHIHGDTSPDLTLYLQSPPAASSNPLFADEIFEQEGEAFYRRVAAIYEQLAKQHPERITLIKSSQGKKRRTREEVGGEIEKIVAERLL